MKITREIGDRTGEALGQFNQLRRTIETEADANSTLQ
jgi:hypothetical protein